jgi:hypothetical protein
MEHDTQVLSRLPADVARFLDAFVMTARNALGEDLHSIVLFGSAAENKKGTGDFPGRYSRALTSAAWISGQLLPGPLQLRVNKSRIRCLGYGTSVDLFAGMMGFARIEAASIRTSTGRKAMSTL